MIANRIKGKAIDRAEWEDLLLHSQQAACFVQPGYLDIIAPGWEAIEVREEEKLVAIMPLYIKRKGGFTYSLQPAFAQFWGIILRDQPNMNSYRLLSWKRKACVAVVEAIPSEIKLFAHTFSPEFDYGTPFHWDGYELHTRYTYRLSMEADSEMQWSKLDKTKRNEINQAEKAGVVIEHCLDLDQVMPLFQNNEDEGKKVLGHASADKFLKLATYLLDGHGGKFLVAKHEGKAIATGIFVYEGNRCTYLAGAQSTEHRKLGGMNALLWQAIELNTGQGRFFDFEGSMIEPIERFFRGFGALPVPYLFIQKNRLPLLVRWIRNLR